MRQQAIPYLMFDGDAKDALAYYCDVFQGEIIQSQTFGETDFDFATPPEADDRIANAQFQKDGLLFMVSDVFPGHPVEKGNNISFALELDSEEEINRLYAALSAKGTVLMELQDTFWGAKYAKVKDLFGITWDLNYTISRLSK
jgi:PhnB protein